MKMYTKEQIKDMEKDLAKLKSGTVRGPIALQNKKKKIIALETEIALAKRVISSGSTTTKTSSRNIKNSEVKSKSPAGDTQSQMMKDDQARSDRIRQLLKNTSGQIENLNPKKQPSVKELKDSPQAPDRQRLEDNLLNVSENQGLGGTKPEDAEMNALEQLVSRIVGRNVRFEDIPDDDPEFGQGEGGIEYPAGRPDLRMGGQVKRMGHGGAITPEQKKRMTRIAKEYKALRSKKKATAPKVTTSKKRAAPFSDMKKARMNGNKKRTNR